MALLGGGYSPPPTHRLPPPHQPQLRRLVGTPVPAAVLLVLALGTLARLGSSGEAVY